MADAINGVAADRFWLRASSALGAMLTAAFGAFAWVLWQGVDVGRAGLNAVAVELRALQTTQIARAQEIGQIRALVDRHMGLGWHSAAGEELARLRAEVEHMRRELSASRRR